MSQPKLTEVLTLPRVDPIRIKGLGLHYTPGGVVPHYILDQSPHSGSAHKHVRYGSIDYTDHEEVVDIPAIQRLGHDPVYVSAKRVQIRKTGAIVWRHAIHRGSYQISGAHAIELDPQSRDDEGYAHISHLMPVPGGLLYAGKTRISAKYILGVAGGEHATHIESDEPIYPAGIGPKGLVYATYKGPWACLMVGG